MAQLVGASFAADRAYPNLLLLQAEQTRLRFLSIRARSHRHFFEQHATYSSAS